MQRRKVIWLSIISMVIVVLAVLAYTFWYHDQEVPLELSGNVDIREVNLAFRVGGKVQSVLVDEGDVVSDAGMLLATIDPEPLAHALDEAKANLAAAEANLKLLTTGYRTEDIAQAKAQWQAQQAVLLNTQQMLARQQRLEGTGALPPTALDDARAARDQAAAQVEAARQQYTLMRSGYREEDIAQARAALAQAQAKVATAQLQLNDAELKAPARGVIITRAVEPGSMVAAGSTVLVLSLNDPVWVRAYVQETDLGRVASGTNVLVHTDTPGGKTYEGVIGFVSPTAEFTPKQVQTPDLRTGWVYRVRVVVSHPDDGLRQGMPVTVTLAPAN